MAERDRRVAAFKQDNGELSEDVAPPEPADEEPDLPEDRDPEVPTPRSLPKD